MVRQLIATGALLAAVLVPIGWATATAGDAGATVQDAGQMQTVLDAQNPTCDGACVGSGVGAGPRNGTGPMHVGPQNGTGNRFGAGGARGAGPMHEAPPNGVGNRRGATNGTAAPDVEPTE